MKLPGELCDSLYFSGEFHFGYLMLHNDAAHAPPTTDAADSTEAARPSAVQPIARARFATIRRCLDERSGWPHDRRLGPGGHADLVSGRVRAMMHDDQLAC